MYVFALYFLQWFISNDPLLFKWCYKALYSFLDTMSGNKITFFKNNLFYFLKKVNIFFDPLLLEIPLWISISLNFVHVFSNFRFKLDRIPFCNHVSNFYYIFIGSFIFLNPSRKWYNAKNMLCFYLIMPVMRFSSNDKKLADPAYVAVYGIGLFLLNVLIGNNNRFFRKVFIYSNFLLWIPLLLSSRYNRKNENGTIFISVSYKVFFTVLCNLNFFFQRKNHFTKDFAKSVVLTIIIWKGLDLSQDSLGTILFIVAALEHVSGFIEEGDENLFKFFMKVLTNPFFKYKFCCHYFNELRMSSKVSIKIEHYHQLNYNYQVLDLNYNLIDPLPLNETGKILTYKSFGEWVVNIKSKKSKKEDMTFILTDQRYRKFYYSFVNKIPFVYQNVELFGGEVKIMHCYKLKDILSDGKIDDFVIIEGGLKRFIIGAWNIKLPRKLYLSNKSFPRFILYQYKFLGKVYNNIEKILRKNTKPVKEIMGNKKFKRFASDVKHFNIKLAVNECKMKKTEAAEWALSEEIIVTAWNKRSIVIENDDIELQSEEIFSSLKYSDYFQDEDFVSDQNEVEKKKDDNLFPLGKIEIVEEKTYKSSNCLSSCIASCHREEAKECFQFGSINNETCFVKEKLRGKVKKYKRTPYIKNQKIKFSYKRMRMEIKLNEAPPPVGVRREKRLRKSFFSGEINLDSSILDVPIDRSKFMKFTESKTAMGSIFSDDCHLVKKVFDKIQPSFPNSLMEVFEEMRDSIIGFKMCLKVNENYSIDYYNLSESGVRKKEERIKNANMDLKENIKNLCPNFIFRKVFKICTERVDYKSIMKENEEKDKLQNKNGNKGKIKETFKEKIKIKIDHKKNEIIAKKLESKFNKDRNLRNLWEKSPLPLTKNNLLNLVVICGKYKSRNNLKIRLNESLKSKNKSKVDGALINFKFLKRPIWNTLLGALREGPMDIKTDNSALHFLNECRKYLLFLATDKYATVANNKEMWGADSARVR